LSSVNAEEEEEEEEEESPNQYWKCPLLVIIPLKKGIQTNLDKFAP